MIDIGAGTMDVLYLDETADVTCKAVVVSPVRLLAARVRQGRGDLLVTGGEMGGGALTQALRERAGRYAVVMSRSASATVHRDPQKVRAMGIRVVEDEEARTLKSQPGREHLALADLDPARVETIVAGFGVPFEFDVVAVCAQDHGRPPEGVSALDYRHLMFRRVLSESPQVHRLLYDPGSLPQTMTRLQCIARSAADLPTAAVYLMDSGMAAILGAALDRQARGRETFAVLDIATSHTVAATLENGRLAGFFEYHTHDITPRRLEALLRDLAEGRLEHQQLLAEGGHGAWVRRAVGLSALETVIATGPKRRMLEGASLPVRWGAPMGDNMMTGTAGLLEAVRRRRAPAADR